MVRLGGTGLVIESHDPRKNEDWHREPGGVPKRAVVLTLSKSEQGVCQWGGGAFLSFERGDFLTTAVGPSASLAASLMTAATSASPWSST